MVELDDRPLTPEEIKARIAEAKRIKAEEALKRDTDQRRAIEYKQRKARVNSALLRGEAPARDETWTIRARADLIKQVKRLAERLSRPRKRVSIAALMEEAMEDLLAKYAKQEELEE